MIQTLLNILHVIVCLFLILVVLLQQGRGGGMGGAFGGATAQVFGGRGAGNFMTRLTAICAAIFMATSISLAYLSSAGDRALKALETDDTEEPAADADKPKDEPGEKAADKPAEGEAPKE